MAAENLNTQYARNSSLLAGNIYKTSLVTDGWHRMIRKGSWQYGISDVQKALTVERNLAANIDTWTAIGTNTGSSNSCALSADVVGNGTTERTFQLKHKAIESTPICVLDGVNAFERMEQTKIAYKILRDNVKYAWQRKAKVDYTDIATKKVIAANGLPFNSSSFPAIAPTTLLTSDLLNPWYQYLLQNSAAEDGGSFGKVNGAPQFVLVTDMETSNNIMRESDNFTAFAESARVPELLAPLGINKPIRGFYHHIDLLPRRYTFSGGTWTEVQPYVSTAADSGTKEDLNPEYISAPYTDSYIFLPNVMEFLHPAPVTTLGAKTKFDPRSYVGDFKWLNVVDVDPDSSKYNPDGTIGFYRAVLSCASKPVSPQYGVVIRHLRCPGDIGAQACPESTAGASSDLGSGDSFFV